MAVVASQRRRRDGNSGGVETPPLLLFWSRRGRKIRWRRVVALGLAALCVVLFPAALYIPRTPSGVHQS